MKYRLIAIDLDGTLLDERHHVPLRNREAIRRAHDAGLRVVLCTGRSFSESRPILRQLEVELDATVTVGGALLTDARTGRTIESFAFSAELARAVGDWFRAREFTLLWLHDAHTCGSDGFAIAGPRLHPAVTRWLAEAPVAMTRVAAIPAEFPPALRISVVDEPAHLAETAEALAATFGPRVAHNVIHVPAYEFTVIETFAGRVDKWQGLRRLCERWDIDESQTVAIGDDVNDVPMLASAGWGVALENARPAAKAAASSIAPSNRDCGVAHVIEQLLNGEAPPPRDASRG